MNAKNMTESTFESQKRLAWWAQQVRTEQVRSVYLQSPVTTIGSLAGGALLVAVMWDAVPGSVLLAWAAALCVHQAVRIYHYRNYLAASPEKQADPKWGRLYTIAATIAGCIWGSAGFLMFVPDSVRLQAILSLILYAVVLVAMTSVAAFARAFYLLVPLTLLPFMVRMSIEPDAIDLYLAAPGLIVLGLALTGGRRINRIITEALTKRFENLDLIEELSRQKTIAERARIEAETANRAKTLFFAAASHDLRQPLHALGLFAAALYERSKDPEVLKVVDSINVSVSALQGLFNELLDIAKIDSGVIRPALAEFSVAGMFDRVRNDFAAEAAAKGLGLTIEGGNQFVRSDEVLLERVIRNLVSNAIRYTQKGAVRLATTPAGAAVRIEVSDTGIGIRPEDQQRVFEEFFQLGNPARTSGKGLGLGLSIVKRLCGLLGCEIRLTSEPGRGSTFSFEVPRADAPTPGSAPAEVSPDRADLSGTLIVVIDDEAAIVESMRVLLCGWGVDVIGSLTGDEVIEAVHAKDRMPDLIIADYRLGGGVLGTGVIERLRRELDPEIPAILITGSAAAERVLEADAHRYDLLLKPVQAEALRGLIGRKLRRGEDGCIA